MTHFPLHREARERCIHLYGVDPDLSFTVWMGQLTGREGPELDRWLRDQALKLLPNGPHQPQPVTAGQARVLRLAACGMHNVEIADALGISPDTVHTQMQQAMNRLGTHSRAHAVVVALAHGMLDTGGQQSPP